MTGTFGPDLRFIIGTGGVGDGEAEMRDRGLIHKSREADVLIGHEKTMAQLTKQIGVTGQACFRRRKRYGGLRVD